MSKTNEDWFNVDEFKRLATAYLGDASLEMLRTYGRKVGLRAATKLKKQALIQETIAVLCGEKKPDRTVAGAPRKNEFLPPEFIVGMETLKKEYLGIDEWGEQSDNSGEEEVVDGRVKEKKVDKKPYYIITVSDEKGEEVARFGTRLDFQISISNQPPIIRGKLTEEE